MRAACVLAAACAVATVAPTAAAQRTDTLPTSAVVTAAAIDTLTDTIPRPPLSPRRAFLYSLAVPGSAQTALGRPRTAALFVTIEALAITMARKSANDLRQAKRYARDSLVTAYQIDEATGRVVLDSSGAPIPAGFVLNDIGVRVAARRTHLEDWIATLAFNHLLSGAEAFVSAHLWDLPAQVSMEHRRGGTFLTARFRW